MTNLSKPSDYWYTPPVVLRVIGNFMPRWFDPCPIDPPYDGLEVQWGEGDCFINPPYSNPLRGRFVDKGVLEHRPNRRFLWLINFGNHKDAWVLNRHASAVCIPQKRIQFIPGHPSLGDGKSPRYDSIFILWGPSAGFKEAFSSIGKVY